MDDRAVFLEKLRVAVVDLRTKFFEETNQVKFVDYEERDIDRVRKDDIFLERFLKYNSLNLDKTLEHVEYTLKWRKDYGIKEIKESSLSKSLQESGVMYPYNYDRKGHPVVMTIGKLHKKERNEDMKRIIVFWVDKLTREYPSKQFTSILDCSDVSYANMDMDLLKFSVTLFTRHYPFSLAYYMVYDMPWIFNAIWKVIRNLLPKQSRNRVVFVNKETITQYIEPKYLPVRMGGECTAEFEYLPEQIKKQYLANV